MQCIEQKSTLFTYISYPRITQHVAYFLIWSPEHHSIAAGGSNPAPSILSQGQKKDKIFMMWFYKAANEVKQHLGMNH